MHYVVNGLADSNHQNLIDRSHYILLSLFMMHKDVGGPVQGPLHTAGGVQARSHQGSM